MGRKLRRYAPLCEYLLLLAGILALRACLVAHQSNIRTPYIRRVIAVGAMLRGVGNLGDISQDMVGFRRLYQRRDPYPVLHYDANREVDVLWDMDYASTHPPTAYLFAAPIAFLSASMAGRVWAAVGLGLLFAAFLLYGIRWKAALGLTFLSIVLLATIDACLPQLGLIWLAGIALAYRCRSTRPFLGGVGIGIASLTKLLPLGIIGYFLFLRKYRAAVGAFGVWVVAAAVIIALEPSAFARYVEVNRTNSWALLLRDGNLSFFSQSYLRFGRLGLAAAVAYFGCLILRNRKALFAPASAPEYSFFLYSFLAVALLPICWNHSLVPLIPVLGYFVIRARLVHILLSLTCFLTLVAFGTDSTILPPVALVPLSSLLFWLLPPKEAQVNLQSAQS